MNSENLAGRDTALRLAIESTANASAHEIVERAQKFLDFLRPANTAATQAPKHPQT
jgi:hypothetical protein